jgi:hypothetical protein
MNDKNSYKLFKEKQMRSQEKLSLVKIRITLSEPFSSPKKLKMRPFYQLLETLLIAILFGSLSPAQALQIPFKTLSESAHSCGQPSDVFDFKSLDLSPDPPHKGSDLTFKIKGNLKEPVVQGAHVKVKVKLGFIQLLDQDMDLCEQIKNVNRECPLPQGPFELEHTVNIPREVPSVSLIIFSQ